MGRRFGWVVGFFSWGGGGGEEELQGTAAEAFSQTTRVPNGPVICAIYYILRSGGFAVPCFRPSRKVASLLVALGQARALFGLRQPVDRARTEDSEGPAAPRSPRTPRSGGYDVYAHAVYVVVCYMSITCICLLYVVICYMSVICYISVICLVLGPSCYMYMSVICCYMLYVCDMLYVCYMSSARGGG